MYFTIRKEVAVRPPLFHLKQQHYFIKSSFHHFIIQWFHYSIISLNHQSIHIIHIPLATKILSRDKPLKWYLCKELLFVRPLREVLLPLRYYMFWVHRISIRLRMTIHVITPPRFSLWHFAIPSTNTLSYHSTHENHFFLLS